MTEVHFSTSGLPVTQGSMRNIGKGRMIHDHQTALDVWRTSIGWHARNALPKRWSKAGAFEVDTTFYFPRPAYLPKTVTLPIAHKNDIDKLCRAVFDAMSQIVYDDDGQVTELHACKRFGTPHVEVTVRRVDS